MERDRLFIPLKDSLRPFVRKDGFEPPTFGYGITLSQPHVQCSNQLSYSRIIEILLKIAISEQYLNDQRAGSGIRTHGVILSFQLGRLAQSTTMRHLHARFFTERLTFTCRSRRSLHSVTLVVIDYVGWLPSSNSFPLTGGRAFPAWTYTTRNTGS